MARVADQLEAARNNDRESGYQLVEDVQDQEPSQEDRVNSQEQWGVAQRRMDRLDPRERAVLALRYGLDGEILTLKQIGSRFGLSGEWVRRIEVSALRKLGDASSDRAFDSNVGKQPRVNAPTATQPGELQGAQPVEASKPLRKSGYTRFLNPSSRGDRASCGRQRQLDMRV